MTDVTEVKVKTPFGDPSTPSSWGHFPACGWHSPRHGHGHRILPTEVNSRANIYALKTLA